MRVDQTRIPADVSRVFLLLESDLWYWRPPPALNDDAYAPQPTVSEVRASVDEMERRLKDAARRALDKTGED